jgi:23S rRNA pseudouridine1911/1915/1917 synthase
MRKILAINFSDAGKRLDHFLQEQLPEYSRSRLQSWIKDGLVLVNGGLAKASLILRGGECVDFSAGSLPPLNADPEDLPLDILYADDAVIAINKPAGVVVHAGAGNRSGTIVNRLVHHFASLSKIGGEERPGIVHRLDKGTSGVLLVARTDVAHQNLAAQFSGRSVEKTYLALVHGRVRAESGRVATPIERDSLRRIRMTTRTGMGRAALTEYQVRQRFEKFTFLEVRIHTGRTHQIRVHLASLGHPVAGDRLYGGQAASRIFLHALRIVFTSPISGERITVEAPLPSELSAWLASLSS